MAEEQCLSVIASRYHVDHQIKVYRSVLKIFNRRLKVINENFGYVVPDLHSLQVSP